MLVGQLVVSMFSGTLALVAAITFGLGAVEAALACVGTASSTLLTTAAWRASKVDN